MLRLLILLPLLAGMVGAQSASGGALRGGKVEWERLRTSNAYWNRHADIDKAMLEFFRQHTSIDVGDTWHAVDAKLENLSRYPFLFAENLVPLTAPERKALAEYLRRGGFIFIDACVNTGANPDLRRFLREHVDLLRAALPDLRIGELPPQHEIFSIHFKMRRFPPTGQPGNASPLHALVLEDRTIGIISVSGVQCGRAGFGEPSARIACTEMMANIYLYAIIH